jgi:hypothetical protein
MPPRPDQDKLGKNPGAFPGASRKHHPPHGVHSAVFGVGKQVSCQLPVLGVGYFRGGKTFDDLPKGLGRTHNEAFSGNGDAGKPFDLIRLEFAEYFLWKAESI